MFLFAFFFTAAHFPLGGRKHFSFKSLPQGNVFSCFSSNEIRLLCFLSLALALSLLSTSLYTLKFSRKKDLALTAVNLSSYGWRI